MNTELLDLEVNLRDDSLSTTIDDRRSDVLGLFVPLSQAQRVSLAGDAWMVGLRAVMNAHRAAEESKLQDIGTSLVDEVGTALDAHVKQQQEAMIGLLRQYFDPREGQVVMRIESFLTDGGDLAKAMERYLAPDHGVLADTLARSLGENSPLLRKLSPTDSEGVVAVMTAKVHEALDANRSAMASALDPLSPDGAVARFLTALRVDLEKADSDRTRQLALATKALDAPAPQTTRILIDLLIPSAGSAHVHLPANQGLWLADAAPRRAVSRPREYTFGP